MTKEPRASMPPDNEEDQISRYPRLERTTISNPSKIVGIA